ncbi:DUF2165 domain-containing protein [Aureibacter tunicatorum]|uniref:Small integral membrane protein n=1 Tax=Aureibacter tunicatorum TaxID=866807 RepID=A0AAE3XMB5_9BACT|nr:DUF2165 domain-containing protein [Aureibacter tunicatorum]MDR6239223.1 putative small integral membrane protein [Aureibacter tunicatorum]
MKRYSKLFVLLCYACYMTMVFFNNLNDWQSNWMFVKGVMSCMDITTEAVEWRRIESMSTQKLFYTLIIIFEGTTAFILWIGVYKMLRSLRKSVEEHIESKKMAVAGLTLMFLIFGMGFYVVGGEFFLSWQSMLFNSVGPGARNMSLALVALIYISMD